MSEERKKKSEPAWKAKEDEELYKSRAFVELTEYIANAVENDTHFFIIAKLHINLYSLHTKAHTLQSHYSVSLTSSFGATIYNLLFLVCFNMLVSRFYFTFSNLDVRWEDWRHFTFVYYCSDFNIKGNCNKNTYSPLSWILVTWIVKERSINNCAVKPVGFSDSLFSILTLGKYDKYDNDPN